MPFDFAPAGLGSRPSAARGHACASLGRGGGTSRVARPAAPPLQGDASAFWAQAKEYYDAKRYAEAAEAYRQYIRLRPDSPEARYWLGSSYYGLKQYADAAAAYREAVRLKPD